MNIAIISPDLKFSEKGIERINHSVPNIKIVELGELYNSEIDVVVVDDSPFRELSCFPNLKAVFSASAGVDNLLSESGLSSIPIVRLTSADMISLMQEYVTYQVIKIHRQFNEIEQLQKNRSWVWYPPASAANTCTVLILGLGQLGVASAKMLQMLGFKVSGWSSSKKSIDGVLCEYGIDSFEKLLPDTNILVCLLPLTQSTKNILNGSIFNKLSHGASIINVSRGGCLNEIDLINAIDCGQISSATLDVFVNEPLPKESKLWDHPKINITPHLAAYPESDSFIDSLIENLQRLESGSVFEKVVNKKKGY